MKSRQLPVVLLLASLPLLATGCSPEAAVPAPPPTADAEPVFASDEEALAAAEAAYEKYLTVTDRVLTQGANPSEYEGVSIGEVLEEDLTRAERFQSDGLRTTGKNLLLDFKLQQYAPGNPEEVIAYGCVDTESVTIVDAAGTDVGDPERQPTATYELRFESTEAGELLLAESTFWKAGPQCDT